MSRRRARYAAVGLIAATLGADCGGEKDCPDCFSTGYRIDLSAIPSGTAPPPAVLFSGYLNGRCRDDLVCTGSPDVHLGDVQPGALDYPRSCDAQDRELLVFAGGQAPVIGQIPPNSTVLPMPRGTPATLSIAVWLFPGPTMPQQIQQDAASAVMDAQRIFDDFGTGILIDATYQQFPTARLAKLPSLPNDAWCDIYPKLNGDDDDGFSPPAAAGRDPTRLNVYWVQEIHYAQNGRTCFEGAAPTSKPYVVFVDGDLTHTGSTLAHELGHALGLIVIATLPPGNTGTDPGDVNELKLDPYLALDNLMRSGVIHVGQVTVGEIYRMHFDERSWLWHGRPPGTDYPRECQSNPVEGGPCPPLTLHPPRGWP